MLRPSIAGHVVEGQADFTHAVVGAGAVGLAIARRLQQVPGTSTVLLERHSAVGTETSSRNSEVIHAGLYYGATSLKTKLCLRGKEPLYELCARHGIPHRRCGKWIVAQDGRERAALDDIHALAQTIGVPTRFVDPDEARRLEPNIRAAAGVLESPGTGIIDSHAYMQYLSADFEHHGGQTALNSRVTCIEPATQSAPWKIYTRSPARNGAEEQTCITADALINSAGLYACEINNMVLPASRHRIPFYAKGTYFSYASRRPRTDRLIYPAPVAGHGGLGTHLTLDMQGAVRFGPDVEWVDSPTDLSPTDDPVRFEAAVREIHRFMPDIDPAHLAVSYAGIRPKLGRHGAAVVAGQPDQRQSSFQDFYICREKGFEAFVNLLAIESPGLTSSLAIAEHVHDLVYNAAA